MAGDHSVWLEGLGEKFELPGLPRPGRSNQGRAPRVTRLLLQELLNVGAIDDPVRVERIGLCDATSVDPQSKLARDRAERQLSALSTAGHLAHCDQAPRHVGG